VRSHQLPHLSRRTTLVSLTVGGNNVGFSDVIPVCILLSDRDCHRAVHAAEHKMITTLPGVLDRLLRAIRHRSRSCSGLSHAGRNVLNQAANLLDRQLRLAAARHGDAFADVRPAFRHHRSATARPAGCTPWTSPT
jgi:hypothetical protein